MKGMKVIFEFDCTDTELKVASQVLEQIQKSELVARIDATLEGNGKKPVAVDLNDDEDTEDEQPKKKRGRKAKAEVEEDDDEDEAPAKKTKNAKKEEPEDEEDDEDSEDEGDEDSEDEDDDEDAEYVTGDDLKKLKKALAAHKKANGGKPEKTVKILHKFADSSEEVKVEDLPKILKALKVK